MRSAEKGGLEAFARGEHTRARGSAAEHLGVAWLEARGYEAVRRNVDTPAGEIDLVALDGEVLCFVEIKARAGSSHGSALDAVTRRKQLRIGRAAALYLAANPWDGPCRFDVLAMDVEGGAWRFTLVRNAFELA